MADYITTLDLSKVSWTPGVISSNTGEFVETEQGTFIASDFIQIGQYTGSYLQISWEDVTSGGWDPGFIWNYGIAFYDAAGTFISGESLVSGDSSNPRIKQFKISSDYSYFRITWFLGRQDDFLAKVYVLETPLWTPNINIPYDVPYRGESYIYEYDSRYDITVEALDQNNKPISKELSYVEYVGREVLGGSSFAILVNSNNLYVSRRCTIKVTFTHPLNTVTMEFPIQQSGSMPAYNIMRQYDLTWYNDQTVDAGGKTSKLTGWKRSEYTKIESPYNPAQIIFGFGIPGAVIAFYDVSGKFISSERSSSSNYSAMKLVTPPSNADSFIVNWPMDTDTFGDYRVMLLQEEIIKWPKELFTIDSLHYLGEERHYCIQGGFNVYMTSDVNWVSVEETGSDSNTICYKLTFAYNPALERSGNLNVTLSVGDKSQKYVIPFTQEENTAPVIPAWEDNILSVDGFSEQYVSYEVQAGGESVYKGNLYALNGTVHTNLTPRVNAYVKQDVNFYGDIFQPVQHLPVRVKIGEQTFDFVYKYDWSYEECFTTDLSRPFVNYLVPGQLFVHTYFYTYPHSIKVNNASWDSNGEAVNIVYGVTEDVNCEGVTYKLSDKCYNFVLYYLNKFGGWDYLPVNAYVNYSANRETYKQDYDNRQTVNANKVNYLSSITKELQIITPYISENADISNLFTSNKIYIHDLKQDKIYPIMLSQNSLDVQTNKRNSYKLINYTFNAEVLHDYVRK